MDRNFEKMLVEQCAPTLAGIKPANLFRFSGGGKEPKQPERFWLMGRRTIRPRKRAGPSELRLSNKGLIKRNGVSLTVERKVRLTPFRFMG